jgi:hypothetical protein
MLTISTALAVLILLALLIYIIDRGTPNALEHIGIILLRSASRMRERRRVIETRQREALDAL